jgi:uncharacterized protein YeaO (DUF488 family)
VTAGIGVKRIYVSASPEDGQRVLVDRIWPRGISKQTASLSIWLRDVAPSSELRKWFGHDAALWDEFRRRYRDELQANDSAVSRLVELAKGGPMTLVYAARDPLHNNAQALAD